MDQCQRVVTQIGASSRENRRITQTHCLTLAPLFNVLKPVAWSETYHGSAGAIVTIGGWISWSRVTRALLETRSVGCIAAGTKWRSRSEPMLYSHKRVLRTSSVKIYVVLPVGCDARSLPWPRASLMVT
jgi:hypothetical protein